MGSIGPKNKIGRQRTHTRRANWKLSNPGLSTCPQCRAPKLAHRVCRSCGYYDGRKVIDVDADSVRRKV